MYGKNQSQICISKPTVDKIACAYKKEDAACLKEKKWGRNLGKKHQLTPAQEKEIFHILTDKSAGQMKLSFILWTLVAVCQLVQEKYGVTITQRNMSEYLKRWGMTCISLM